YASDRALRHTLQRNGLQPPTPPDDQSPSSLNRRKSSRHHKHHKHRHSRDLSAEPPRHSAHELPAGMSPRHSFAAPNGVHFTPTPPNEEDLRHDRERRKKSRRE